MVRWSIQISQQCLHFHQRIIYINKALQGRKMIYLYSPNSQLNLQVTEMQNYISSCALDMYPCDFFHSLPSSLCSKLVTGSHSWERRGVIAKHLLLKKTLEETCFPASWIKATLGWYRNDKNSSLLLTHQACAISGSCYWCWDHIAELRDFTVIDGFWSCLPGHVYFCFQAFEGNVGYETLF